MIEATTMVRCLMIWHAISLYVLAGGAIDWRRSARSDEGAVENLQALLAIKGVNGYCGEMSQGVKYRNQQEMIGGLITCHHAPLSFYSAKENAENHLRSCSSRNKFTCGSLWSQSVDLWETMGHTLCPDYPPSNHQNGLGHSLNALARCTRSSAIDLLNRAHRVLSSGYHECLYKLSWLSIQYLSGKKCWKIMEWGCQPWTRQLAKARWNC